MGQVFSILQGTNELQMFVIGTGNSNQPYTIGQLPPGGINALGFRSTDNFLYGINSASNHLFRIGQNAVSQDLGAINLDPALFYLAGDISPDGKYLVAIGSDAAGDDVSLSKIDLSAPGFPVQSIPVSGAGHLEDIVFDPFSTKIYGFDRDQQCVVTLDISTGIKNLFPKVEDGNWFYGMYFDAFGDLYAVGSTLYGIVDGFFSVNKNTGKEHRITTGPSTVVGDLAACPYSVEMKCTFDPAAALPCSDVTLEYRLVNGSNETLNGLEFRHALPAGFHFSGVLSNTFGALIDTMVVPGSLVIKPISLTPGQRMLKVTLHVDDLPKGVYSSQPEIQQLPAEYGLISLSDFTGEAGFEDSSLFRVTRYDQDTLSYHWFICHGEMLTLDATEFGAHINWNTGAVSQALVVDTGGVYSFKAGTVCEQVFVDHEVTSASCPYTISVDHLFVPDTSFACSDLIFRFILKNDSGEPRFNISFQDTFPPGFTFVRVESDLLGGKVLQDSGAAVVVIQGMTLPVGRDTLDVLVHAGDIAPGKYHSRAFLRNLPVLMGPIRLSDNPLTFPFDSSVLVVRGALSDTLYKDTVVCANAPTILDATDLGKTFLWDNGSSLPLRTVDSPGLYSLLVFDGCEPAEIYWNVAPAPLLMIHPPPDTSIHQGESIALKSWVDNLGDSLFVSWMDPFGNSLSCVSCLSPLASPLESADYQLIAANELCSDTVHVHVSVDDSRRVFAPQIFSPNDDGQNDYFFLQSPDYGLIKKMVIYDRWGNLCFEIKGQLLNSSTTYWDGFVNGKPPTPGVYIWLAEIEFVDGSSRFFTGDVSVFR